MKSIRSKIMWLLISSVIISSLLISSLAVIQTSEVIGKSANENMHLLCKTNADSIDIILAKVEDSIDTLAHAAVSKLPRIDYLQNESFRSVFSAELQENALRHIDSSQDAVAVYLFYNPTQIDCLDGFFFSKSLPSHQFTQHKLQDVISYNEEDPKSSVWWHQLMGNGTKTWHEAYYKESINRYVISYITPVYKDSRIVAVIGADIAIDSVEDLAKNVSIYKTGKAAILNSDGTVMYHPNFDRNSVIGEGDPGFDGVVHKLTHTDHINELIPYQLNGIEKRITSCKLRNGMLLVCFAPISEIYAEQNAMILSTLSITVIIVLSALLMAVFVSREMTRPLKKLNEAAKHLTDGDFEFDIQATVQDEIGELTSTFLETRQILIHQLHLLDTEAHRDGLTGVGNKSAFIDRENEINKSITEKHANFCVAVFDVNKLKVTNDILGHIAGDRLLCAVSEHLSFFFSPENIFRVGGDEFIVIISHEENCQEQIKKCVDSMKDISVSGYPSCSVSCAYGFSFFNPVNDRQLSDVLHRADAEMYKNKAISKKDASLWSTDAKGIKELQIEKYSQLLQTLTNSTDDYLLLLNTETGTLQFFGESMNTYDITDESELAAMLSSVYVNDHALIRDTIASVMNQEASSFDISFRMHNGMRWVNCRGGMVEDENNNHFVVIGRISQNAIKHLYNPVTSLFNKNKLKADLQSGSNYAFKRLMLLDIDHLSEINLKHGSVYGDNLLKLLAEELESRFSLQQIYHAEKDRFAILLDLNTDKDTEHVFNLIKDSMKRMCSVSAAVVVNDTTLPVDLENIYDYAVQVLNNSKKDGRGQLVFSSRERYLENISAVELLEELEESVKQNCSGFHLLYQPQINAVDYSIISVEALLRYTSKTKGPIFPDQLIPILERSGLINDVGLWVVNQALIQCKHWRKFIPDFKISVNLSPRQLENKRLAFQIIKLLSKHNLPGDALILEITESTQFEEIQEILDTLEKLKLSGIQIAIDDFGTGYSNLGHLKHIHASILKVDRIFIQDVKENGYNYNLIHNIIEFAKANQLSVCLEGVENTAELLVLTALKPHSFQGYLFDRPVTAALIEAKYMNPDTEEYADRLNLIDLINNEKRHAPIYKMEPKTILRSLDIGLWIIRINKATGQGELYTDETMRRLLGVDNNITPAECYKHWNNNIKDSHRDQVNAMVTEMQNTDNVVQVEYPWYHPQNGEITVRCSGRGAGQDDEYLLFEGFHRTINDLEKIF